MLQNNDTKAVFIGLAEADLIGKNFPADLAGEVDQIGAHLCAGGTLESFWADYVFAPIDNVALRQQTAESLAPWAMTLLLVAPALKQLSNFSEIADTIALVSGHAEVKRTPLLAAVFHLLAKELDISVLPKAFAVGRDALSPLVARSHEAGDIVAV